MFFFCLIALNEFFIISSPGQSRKNNYLYFLFGMFNYVVVGLIGLGYLDIRFAFLILLTFPLTIVSGLFKKTKHVWRTIGIQFTGWFYLSIPFGLLNALFLTPVVDGYYIGLLLGLFIIIWTSDVFAYLVGSAIGKHRLFERISPKKSWEGSIGGLVFALIAAYLLSLFFTQISLVDWMVLAVIIVVAGTFGDLSESLLKREAGVKDSGTILPGHGGVLDRFDATLFAAPFVFVYINLF